MKLNKKKGTAFITVSVSGAGSLVLAGKGAKKTSAFAKAAGKLGLTIKAAGKAEQKLTETGKVKLALKVSLAPVGGVPATQMTKLTLKLDSL